MKKYFITLIFVWTYLVIVNSSLKAQQLPLYSGYMFNGLAYNPAYGGNHTKGIELTGVFRTQYINVEGGPKTSLLTGHTRLKETKTAVGGTLLYDTIGVNTNLYFMMTYAYHMPISKKYTLSLGVQAGLISYQADFTKLRSFTDALRPDATQDTTLTQKNASQISYNVGVSIYFYSDELFFSVSSPLLLETQFNVGETTNFTLARHYFLSAGGVFPISRVVKLRPTAYMRLVGGAPAHVDFNIMGIFYEKFWIGTTIRTTLDYSLIAQMTISQKYKLGYAFDIYNSQAAQLGGGHEITLNVLIGKKQIILDDPRYF